MSPIRFDELIYDACKGQHVADAAALVVRCGFGGFVFNGLVVRRSPGDTAGDLEEKYNRMRIEDNIRSRDW